MIKSTMTSKDFFRWMAVLASALISSSVIEIGVNAATHSYSIDARPTVQPLPTPAPTASLATPTVSAKAAPPKVSRSGAYIRLMPGNTKQVLGLRATVQWQGRNDHWYVVDGWQSIIDGRPIEWWVAPADFGKGPFRWIIYRDSPQQPLHISASFYLPTTNDTHIDVQWPVPSV